MPDFKTTLWYAPIGVGDGQDVATRGYLRSLMAVNYEWVIAQPDRHARLDDPDLDAIRQLFGSPAQFRYERPRVLPGDPRVGQRWKQFPDTWTVGAGAPGDPDSAGSVVTWDNIIREGDVDHDIPIPHPSERWQPKTELIVLHFDPSTLARVRDAMARATNGATPIVGITAWETDRIPAGVAQQLSDLDYMVVPSQHTINALVAGGFDAPASVVPHAILMDPPSSEELGRISTSGRYVFYTIGTNIERKYLRGVIAAYCRAFAGSNFKDVGLVIKTRDEAPGLRKLYKDGIELSGTHTTPKIAIYGDKWSNSRVRELHLQSDCWVDATRAEGFGLGQAEAAIMGNAVITTNWGAQTEVLDVPGVEAKLVDFTLVPVDEAMAAIGVYRADQKWADPSIDHLAEHMLQLASSGKKAKQLVGAAHMAARYGVSAVGDQLNLILKSVLK